MHRGFVRRFDRIVPTARLAITPQQQIGCEGHANAMDKGREKKEKKWKRRNAKQSEP